ncbi:MAG: S8 family peptidase [Nitrospiraceae bacterium]
MPDQQSDNRPHFIIKNSSTAKPFTAYGGGGSPPPPQLPRAQHGASLQAQLHALRPIAETAAGEQSAIGLESGLGIEITFTSQPGVELAFEKLANDPKKIELLSVRTEGDLTYANVFVPDGKLQHFEKYVADYLAEKKKSNGTANDNKSLLNTIAEVRAAEVRALWTDDLELLPQAVNQLFWWEVWLPVRDQREKVVADFRKLASLANCIVSEHQVNFPERTVVLMYGSQQQLSQSVMTLNCVAELRRAKDTAEFFDGMAQQEQQEWLTDALTRLSVATGGDSTPRICLLDSGVNQGHPLLTPIISDSDVHAVNPAWGTDDQANHGTGLAGLATYGDLTEVLSSQDPIVIAHRLESVKLISQDGGNQGDAKHHAYLFAEAVSRPEVTAPHRPRLFSSAVTATDYRDKGRPSSWSSMVDLLASDADGSGQFPRLMILSAGNTRDSHAWLAYPSSLSTNLIHDPGQAWNALTVGAFTQKIETADETLTPIAKEGGLSPFTTTSRTWENVWPLKPDVVMEGGNAGKDSLGAIGIPSLNLLTTNYRHLERLFTTTNATSAASALCARMAAQLMAAYPNLRPETIRALIVHSAEWTPAMRQMYLPTDRTATKKDYVNLIRHCGWGVPNLSRALWSASNSLTLIAEDVVHPYKKVQGEGVKTRDMNLHALPWPKEELLTLQEAKVQMRVTLSYFIEPNPSARGTASKFYYPSHRLRFDVQRPLDASTDEFIARINKAAARDDEGDPINPKDADWHLGDYLRHRGSLHQDIWEGTAADLASRGFIAVYPSSGWWRTRPALKGFDLPARYSLIVSIRTAQTDIDLYTAIANQIAVTTEIEL